MACENRHTAKRSQNFIRCNISKCYYAIIARVATYNPVVVVATHTSSCALCSQTGAQSSTLIYHFLSLFLIDMAHCIICFVYMSAHSPPRSFQCICRTYYAHTDVCVRDTFPAARDSYFTHLCDKRSTSLNNVFAILVVRQSSSIEMQRILGELGDYL